MTIALSNRPVSVKSATSAPLSAKTAANCATMEAANTQKSSVPLPLRPAALAGSLRAARPALRLPGARTGRGLPEDDRYADAPPPEDRPVRRLRAWGVRVCRMPATSLGHPARGVQGESGQHQHVGPARLSLTIDTRRTDRPAAAYPPKCSVEAFRELRAEGFSEVRRDAPKRCPHGVYQDRMYGI